MKITGVKFIKLCGSLPPSYKDYERVARPLDVYMECAKAPVWDLVDPDTNQVEVEDIFLVITTDEGIEGVYGPVFEQVVPHIFGIVNSLIGKDPLDILIIWDQMLRLDRHGRTGYSMVAISSIDCALWDLKGKYLNMPVHKVLGGNRKVKAYASTLGYPLEPEQIQKKAKEIIAMGYEGQKWFFRYGPADGYKGIEKNMELAYSLREACGKDYDIMFDAWMGWDLPYARMMLKELESVNPAWIEEPLMPNMIDAYYQLHNTVNVPIAAGEHLYTRWQIKPFLDKGILDIVEADPSWTGGITELVRIGSMCETYGIPLMPHGCTTPAGTIVCSVLSPAVAPYMEFLIPYQERQQLFQKYRLFPKDGFLMPFDHPGLALEFDFQKVKKIQYWKDNVWKDYRKSDMELKCLSNAYFN
ncbi:MAG: enolase C-terminal domain-like protein [Massiliimalia sp.]|jgi:L-rhamnonate dehydratase